MIKDVLEQTPMSVKGLSEKTGLEFHYLYGEIQELIALGKIKVVKHDGEDMLLWTTVVPLFEYELANNIVSIDKKYSEFSCTPSLKNQMKLPSFVIKELKKKLSEIKYPFQVILELKAIQVEGTWHKIQKEKIENG